MAKKKTTKPRAFTVAEISEYTELKREQARREITCDRLTHEAKRIAQTLEQERKALTELRRRLEDYAELDSAGLIQNTEETGVKYVKSSRKEDMFQVLIDEYATENPKAESIRFSELHERLTARYGVECRSVSNFFKDILSEYDKIGGKRNRAIMLKR